MITADLGLPAGSAPRILLLGAHCDDIEIGCGGMLQVLAALYPRGEFRWSVFSSTEERAEETRRAAAMLLPDLQLLLVSAKYSAPVLLRERVLTRKYQDAYQDLQAASSPEGKVVIEDLLANGLASKPAKGQAPDAATIDGKTVSFDGQWRKAKLKEEEYGAVFSAAEQQYVRLLGLLIAQAKAS